MRFCRGWQRTNYPAPSIPFKTSATVQPSTMSFLSCKCFLPSSRPQFTPRCSDAGYFPQPTRSASQPSDNWVLRLGSLKRLFRLISQYFADVLHQPTHALGVPDLQAIAENFDIAQTLTICRLTIAIAVQSSKKKDVIERIQQLNEADQHALMRAIEEVSIAVCEPLNL